MAVLNKYLDLEEIPEIKEFFFKRGELKMYRKNEFFIKQGQKSESIGFITEGSFRYLRSTSEGREQIVGYSFENDFVADYAALQTGTNSVIDARAIKDSTVLVLYRKDVNYFFNNCSDKSLGQKIAEVFLADIYSRLLSLYCETPEERYTNLVRNYPQILNQVSLKEIASFIKVTPETLSRIRKKIYKS
jgi:cAMP-binding proteins - catabolite gene activator and regulatory subunit of cAMP-dependent protein kinases